MISKKVCMLGGYSVGKTSLVDQYVNSFFSDKYLSTVGVKISKKNLSIAGEDMGLVLWDMEGKDIFSNINLSYLRGAMGFFAVADGTRKETLDTALALRKTAIEVAGEIPYCILLNKTDLQDQWEVTDAMLTEAIDQGVDIFRTSAKTGEGVDEAFTALARMML